jgi:7-carboxy-7-deazaguanine synthase
MKVVEVFGPTVQGEGPYAGRVCHFLRLGGCDYRCSWCDTMYAVEPALVRAAEDLDDVGVLERLEDLAPAPMLVISGGNPALWALSDDLVSAVLDRYAIVSVETQGTRWRGWLDRVDCLVVSPKPPSSGMASAAHWHAFDRFMNRAGSHRGLVLKVVVFNREDLEWARMVHEVFGAPLYLSAGTDQGAGDAETVAGVADRFRWLCEEVAETPDLHDATLLPQLHVVAWGTKVGV